MNEVAFLASVMECKKILEEWELLLKASVNNLKNASTEKYSDEFKKVSKGDAYFPTYKCAIENDDYDFLLVDQSFFQFSYDYSAEKGCEIIRFAFYPSVTEYSYEAFLVEQLGENIEKCGSEYYELYQQYISEQTPMIRTAFRYDYDRSLYKKQNHSAAHIHFGNEENIRIPTNSQLKPTAFVKMVMEYYYYNQWKVKIEEHDKMVYVSSHDTEILDAEMFGELDQSIPYIFVKDRKK